MEDPETPIALLQIKQKSFPLQKYNQPAQYDHIKMVGPKSRVLKLDVDDPDDRFLGQLSKECHNGGNQNWHNCGWYTVLLSLLSPQVSYISVLTANKPLSDRDLLDHESQEQGKRCLSQTKERKLIVFQEEWNKYIL